MIELFLLLWWENNFDDVTPGYQIDYLILLLGWCNHVVQHYLMVACWRWASTTTTTLGINIEEMAPCMSSKVEPGWWWKVYMYFSNSSFIKGLIDSHIVVAIWLLMGKKGVFGTDLAKIDTKTSPRPFWIETRDDELGLVAQPSFNDVLESEIHWAYLQYFGIYTSSRKKSMRSRHYCRHSSADINVFVPT